MLGRYAKMKYLLVILSCTISAIASGPGAPADKNEVAQIVFIGKPSKVEEKYFIEDKEYTKADAYKYSDALIKEYAFNSKKGIPRLQIEYIVTLKVTKILKGSFISESLRLKWRDLADSRCPHIPLEAFKQEGIWYSGSLFNEGPHNHSIYWMPNVKDNLEVILKTKQTKPKR